MENSFEYRCFTCGNELNIKWDENSNGYSAKLGVCPVCGKVVILQVIEDRWIKEWERDMYDDRCNENEL